MEQTQGKATTRKAKQKPRGQGAQQWHNYACQQRSPAGQQQISQLTLIIDNLIKLARNHLYVWVERGTVRVKCLAQVEEHKTQCPLPGLKLGPLFSEHLTEHVYKSNVDIDKDKIFRRLGLLNGAIKIT